MFATVVPGLARLVAAEIAQLPGLTVTGTGFDGRSDLVMFDVARGSRPSVRGLSTIEDLFVEVGRTVRRDSDRAAGVARRLWPAPQVERALSVWAAEVRPLAGTMSYRVVARVLQERAFLRTELRTAMTEAVKADRPRWRTADPAQVEIWASEYVENQFVAGLRLSDATMRQHDGRAVERRGALRPTVAAMMVALAGEPAGALLDPCCGSGTILGEAVAAGWPHVHGGDIDPDAVATAARNVPSASVERWDVRQLALGDASVGAVVSNLPFGRQFDLPGSPTTWLAAAMAEMARVLRPGGRLVLLVPKLPASALPADVQMRSRDTITLLGVRTGLWLLDRATASELPRQEPHSSRDLVNRRGAGL